MDTNDIVKVTQAAHRLIEDQQYYQYVFKKTERIVSVVFYVSQNIKDTSRNKTHLIDIEDTARNLHNVVLGSLEVRAHVADDVVDAVVQALVALESKLQIGYSVGLYNSNVLNLLYGEIDSVLRTIKKYKSVESPIDLSPASTAGSLVAKSTSNVSKSKEATPSAKSTSRREHIMATLESLGEATIKDISEVVTDVSTKTIQRELMSMIKDNLVEKEGEKRWSKYRLNKGQVM
tara:strand:+ start:6501 stop:7199 length:699 start_codon:yes stop_codon:yes gene_type:complete